MSHSSGHSQSRHIVQVVTCLIGVAIFSLIHFVSSFGLRISLGLPDTIEDRGEPSALWEAGRIVVLILWFPGLALVRTTNINGWVLLVGNSILWGTGLFVLFVGALRLAGVQPINWSGRFSLRSLLLAIAAAALVLGLIGVAT